MPFNKLCSACGLIKRKNRSTKLGKLPYSPADIQKAVRKAAEQTVESFNDQAYLQWLSNASSQDSLKLAKDLQTAKSPRGSLNSVISTSESQIDITNLNPEDKKAIMEAAKHTDEALAARRQLRGELRFSR